MIKLVKQILNKDIPPATALLAIKFLLETPMLEEGQRRALRLDLMAPDIDHAMSLVATPQGVDFWSDIHNGAWNPRDTFV